MKARGLTMLDQAVAEGRHGISADEARGLLGRSPQATANILSRLVRDGWLERARRGHYLIRPLGQLDVPASSREEVGALVAAAAGNRLTRIAYATALQEHDLLVRPWRPIQFAVDRRLWVKNAGNRPFETHVERPQQFLAGAEPLGPSFVSTVERALLESAQRPRHVAGIATVAEALARAEVQLPAMCALAEALAYSVGLRRLVALDHGLNLHRLDGMELQLGVARHVALDPTDVRAAGPLDPGTGVRWPGPVEEFAAVVGQ